MVVKNKQGQFKSFDGFENYDEAVAFLRDLAFCDADIIYENYKCILPNEIKFAIPMAMDTIKEFISAKYPDTKL